MSGWKLFACVVPVCLAIDLLWLGVVMKDFYSRELGDLARRQGGSLAPRWGAALLVYVVIPAGFVLFARPTERTYLAAGGWAALFGFILYGVYDLTNYAVLEKWTLRMTVADMAWGTTLCGILGIYMHWLTK